MSEVKAGIGGEHYQPYAERTGGESVVFFTRDLSAEGLKKAYAAIQGNLTGKVAVKLHTGEQNGPNIIPRPWVKSLMEQIPNSTIVETRRMKVSGTPPRSTAVCWMTTAGTGPSGWICWMPRGRIWKWTFRKAVSFRKTIWARTL